MMYSTNNDNESQCIASTPLHLEPIRELLQDFKSQVKHIYATRLHHILLYGSWARDEATEHSDIDLLIALEGVVNPGQEIDRLIDVVTDLNLKYDALLSVYPISVNKYITLHSPLLLNVRREGIVI